MSRHLIICVLVFFCALSRAAPPSERSVTVGPARFSFLSPTVIRFDASDASGVFEDRPSVTFPHRNALPIPPYTVVEHSDTELFIVTPIFNLSFVLTSRMAIDCRHLNITFFLAGKLVTACFGEAMGRTPLDPNPPHAGILMDEWTDIVLGAPTYDSGGNLNGSVDTTDCYEGADLCFNS